MTTPTIESKVQVLHSTDGLVDLYCFDCTGIGGSIYYFSPQCYSDGTLLSWGGQAYSRLAIGLDNLERKSTATSLPQPTLILSNIGGPLLSAVETLGDLVGAKLTHWKVYVSYLDGQANPSTAEYIGPEIWYVMQKASHTNQSIAFTMCCIFDKPGFQFPIRQYIIDPNVNPPDGIYFPGMTPYRMNQSSTP